MSIWDNSERAALVALLRTRPPTLFEPDQSGDDAIANARRDIESWTEVDFRFLTFQDDDYPAQLREVHQMPPVLFSQGELCPSDSAVSVVGSRQASESAIRTATEIASMLAASGLTVVSGLAEGIDTAAHVAAVNCGGRTVAVIGTGIRRYFPAVNRELQRSIAANGLVLSQFWPNAPPTRQTFPMRNATMSAYGRATIIVEAGEHSGARSQARSAIAHGRPVILMTSVAQGTN